MCLPVKAVLRENCEYSVIIHAILFALGTHYVLIGVNITAANFSILMSSINGM